jgi:hypothetical protein
MPLSAAADDPVAKLQAFWNARYAGEEFVYGREPNDFVVQAVPAIPQQGRVLCLADGEGRNSVWLARQGFRVTAVDVAEQGLAKGRELARASASRSRRGSLTRRASTSRRRRDAIVSTFPTCRRARRDLHLARSQRSPRACSSTDYGPEQRATDRRTAGPLPIRRRRGRRLRRLRDRHALRACARSTGRCRGDGFAGRSSRGSVWGRKPQ